MCINLVVDVCHIGIHTQKRRVAHLSSVVWASGIALIIDKVTTPTPYCYDTGVPDRSLIVDFSFPDFIQRESVETLSCTLFYKMCNRLLR